MKNKFLTDIDLSETVEDSENQTTSPYQLTSELLDKGFDYDNSAIYVPYTFKYERNADTRDIYLKIERIPNQKTNFMIYSWTSLENGQYRILNSFRRDILLTEEDIDSASKSSINRKLSHLGRIARLNATEGSYKGFFESLLIDIVNSSCLDIFKVLDYDFSMFDEDSEEENDVEEDFIAEEIEARRNPTLTDEEIAEASEVENKIKEIGAIAYLDNIVDKFHIGNHKNIYREHIAGFNIIRGRGSYFIYNTAKSGRGKTLEHEIAILKLIPREYIFRKNQMTLASFSRYGQSNMFYFDRMIVYFGDLGGRKSFDKVEDVFDVFKVLITEKVFSRDISEGTSKGGFENASLTLAVKTVGAVFQTVKIDFLNDSQLESRSIESTPFEANKETVLDLIFALEMEDSKENKSQEEADVEVKKYHNYLKHLITKDIKIINPFRSFFKRLVRHSDIDTRDMKQLLELFEGFCVLTYFDCKEIKGKYIASQKQLKTFVNSICLDNTLAPIESNFLKMLIGINDNGKSSKYALTIIDESDEESDENPLQIYHNTVLEAIGELENLDKFQTLTIDTLEDFKKKKAIGKLLEMFKLRGTGQNHEENVFFRVSDIKGAYASKRAYKDVDDVGILLNKLYDKGLINKLDFYDSKRQNIYYLTSKSVEVTSTVELTEEDIVESQNFLIYQGILANGDDI